MLIMAFKICYAQGAINLTMPSAPGNYQSDKFRSGDMECSVAIGASTNVEFGVVGIIDDGNHQNIISTDNKRNKDVGVYGRIIIPIGAPKNRLDCDSLYQLELRKKRMEIQRLEAELHKLKSLSLE